MAQTSWPSPTHNARAVSEAEYEHLARRNTDDGIYGKFFNDTPIVAGAGLQVLVRPDFYGQVRGFTWSSGTTEDPVAISPNDSTPGPRIDWVVLRLDRSTWEVRVAVREGTPGAAAPALVQDPGPGSVYEIPLAKVTVPVGAAGLTDNDVVPNPLYIGTRIRPAGSTAGLNPNPEPGEIAWLGGSTYVQWNGSAWTTILEDTGWVTLSPNGPDGGAWTNNNIARARRRNGHTHIRFAVRRYNNANLPLNDANGSAPYTLPVAFRPTEEELGFGFHNRSPVAVRVEPTGHVRLFPLETAIPAGATILGTADYFN